MSKACPTCNEIVPAALKLFSEKGYLGATTKEISRVAGVSEVTLFRHFTTKEKLLEEVTTRYPVLPAWKRLFSGIPKVSYGDALTALAHRLLDFHIKHKDWIRIMQAEVQRSPDSKQQVVYHRFMAKFFDALAAYFRTMQAKGVLRDFDPDYGARAFHGMVYSYFHMEYLLMRSEYKSTGREKAIEEFVAIFIKGTQRQE